jgi:hypothetical protein
LTQLTDDERGRLMVIAARYALKWAAVIGTFFLIASWAFAPDMITTALWWYPFAFIMLFLSKRQNLLRQAQNIINR